jgi:hypothetical protein
VATRDSTRIETVFVTLAGKILDLASFAKSADAERYKAAVRRWARERGLSVLIRSQAAEVGTPLPRAG